jgi:hypothetical protein
MSTGHLSAFLLLVFQEPLVYTAAIMMGFATALLFGNAVVGIVRGERR